MTKKYRIEFGDLRLGDTSWKHLSEVHKTNWASAGPKVAEFENQWGRLFSYKYNKAVSSGTDAVLCAVAALYDFGAQRGDEVIVPALSFIATSNAVLAAGFQPVFVDVQLDNMNLDHTRVEDAITSRTRAIMAVTTMGKPCNMAALRYIADRHKILLIADDCEGHGCHCHGNFMGSWADASTYSFYVAHLICCGEGGMVSTQRQDVADAVNSIRTHGRKNGDLFFDFVRFGVNAKMNDLEASLGLEGIEHFWDVFNTRKRNLNRLLDLTRDLEEHCWFNQEDKFEITCPHAFSVILKGNKNCTELSRFLDDKGIKCKKNFGCIPTQHAAYNWASHVLGDFPNAEYIGDNGLHFGCHQYLTDDDLVYASDCLHEYFKSGK